MHTYCFPISRSVNQVSTLGIWICFGVWCSSIAVADDPTYHSLVTQGLKVSDSKHISLTAPSLVDGMSEAEQKAAIEALAAEHGMERFMKNSPVSPFVLEIKSVEKLANGLDAQRMDVWFTAYGTIDSILDKKLLEDLAIPDKPTKDELANKSRELTAEELTKNRLTVGELADKTRVSYRHAEFSLLDKVRLSLVTHAQHYRSPESLILVNRIHEGIVDLPSTWSPITVDADDKVTLGPKQPYASGASYTKVTELKFEPKALLIEMHVLFVEPQQWFNGRNLLRSKLPPVVQDGLRKFRRRLAQ